MTDPISNERLEPCPFCGGTDIFVEPDEIGSGGQWVPPVHVGCNKCKAEQLADYASEAIAAWNLRQSPAGVEVKGLEWREIEVARSDEDPNTEPTGDYEAETAFGPYYIAMYFGSDSYGWEVQFDAEAISDHDGPEAAKAAAQADYERRVLSSLSVKEPEVVVPVAWFIPPDADGVYQQVSTQHYGDPDLVPLYASPPPKAVTISDDMVNEALSVWRDYEFSEPPVRDFSRMRATLTAALSSEAHNG